MKATIRFTYQTVTPKSAEQGDYADHGYYEPGGWRYTCAHPAAQPESSDDDEYNQPSLSAALKHARNSLGIIARDDNDNTRWWESVDPDVDYATGEHTHYALHIDGITDSTRKRINHWLAQH